MAQTGAVAEDATTEGSSSTIASLGDACKHLLPHVLVLHGQCLLQSGKQEFSETRDPAGSLLCNQTV